MIPSRRRFLSLLAAAPAAASAAAKSASAAFAQQAAVEPLGNIAALSGASTAIADNAVCSPNPYHHMPSSVVRWFGSPAGKAARAAGLPIPEFIKREVEHYAFTASGRIDPDIASLRSVSLSAKVLMQRRRNETRLYEAIERGVEADMLREAFMKTWFPDEHSRRCGSAPQ